MTRRYSSPLRGCPHFKFLMLLRDLIQRYDDSGSCDEQDYEALRAFFEKTCYEYDYNISLDDHDDA